jgi:hypothetical protein
MDCGHGWHCAIDCDTCTLQRVAPKAADRIAQLENAIVKIIDAHEALQGALTAEQISERMDKFESALMVGRGLTF